MLPCMTVYDHENVARRDAVIAAQILRDNATARPSFADFAHLVGCYLGVNMLLARCVTPFVCAVTIVVQYRAYKEVTPVAAGGIVTTGAIMADEHTIGYGAVMQFVSKAVRRHDVLTDHEMPVALAVLVTSPRVAGIGAARGINLCPKSFFGRGEVVTDSVSHDELDGLTLNLTAVGTCSRSNRGRAATAAFAQLGGIIYHGDTKPFSTKGAVTLRGVSSTAWAFLCRIIAQFVHLCLDGFRQRGLLIERPGTATRILG